MNHNIAPQDATPSAVEHVIGYAYPSSTLATQLGFAKSGCFTVQVAGTLAPAKTYNDARAAVKRLGTTPGRWSWDHANNSHLSHHRAECGANPEPLAMA